MGISSEHPRKTEYDIIICGAGPAGCVVAGRLTAANPSLSILLIESGSNNQGDPQVHRPAQSIVNLSNLNGDGGRLFTKYVTTVEEEACNGRRPVIPCGNVLGGGGSVNLMMYVRGSASDYDDWNTEGWSSKDLIPLLQKTETYNNLYNPNPDTTVHGFSGPLHVSQGNYTQYLPPDDPYSSSTDEFLPSVEKRGYRIVPDLENLKESNAFERWAKWISPITGFRSDPATGYVHPYTSNPNFTVLCNHKVIRVLFNSKRVATGVEYTRSPPGPVGTTVEQDISLDQTIHTAHAKRMVIISSGSLGTPQILERSGIGSFTVLQNAGVTSLLVDLPGVGENLQDRPALFTGFRMSPKLRTHNAYISGDATLLATADSDLETLGRGLHTTNILDVGGKVRPNVDELRSMGEEFGRVWKEKFENKPDKPVIFLTLFDGSVFPPGKPVGYPENTITGGIYLQYPLSRGYIHITSPTDPTTPPIFTPGFLSNSADIPPLVWAYKLTRELIRQMPSYRGEFAPGSPPFSSTSNARLLNLNDPLMWEQWDSRELEKDLVYTEEDERVLVDWIRDNVTTTWHALGTCAMKPREERGVVDKRLNVYGVKRLKVADLSILPDTVGANTYSTALLVGEKAAVLIAEELGLKLK